MDSARADADGGGHDRKEGRERLHSIEPKSELVRQNGRWMRRVEGRRKEGEAGSCRTEGLSWIGDPS